MMHRIFFFLTYAILLSACYPENNRLEDALIQAKENRTELQKVLEHYSKAPQDTLKYKAAFFLIENMPGHYSIKNTPTIQAYYNEIDSLAKLYDFPRHDKRDSLFAIIREKYQDTQLEYVADIECITTDYLINNIEQSFSLWQDGNWAKHISFEEFCEYLLPYKVTTVQLLDNWKEYFEEYCIKYVNEIYCDQHINLAIKACEVVNTELSHTIQPALNSEEIIPVGRMSTLANVPYGTCDEYAILTLAVMRTRGIPVAIDYTPQWPFRSMGHVWNVVLDNTGKNVPFAGAMSRPGDSHKEDHKMAKVFRKVYTINREIEDIHKQEKYIPETFETPFIKDVTFEYMSTQDVSIQVSNRDNHVYAYLAVFDNKEWIPVHWGKYNDGSVTFKNMGKDIVYLPLHYGVNGIEAVAAPFILTIQRECKELVADTLHKQTVKLYRKHPLFTYADFGGKRMVGAKIQASNDSLFRDAKTVYTIPKATTIEDIPLSGDSLTYRYWRYLSPDNGFCNLAELAFYEKDSIGSIAGEIIGTEGAMDNDEQRKKQAVFDKTLLTYFDAPVWSGGWVGMDFGRPVTINRIVCVARGDGNCIEPGNEYELQYWDKGTWSSMGKKIADDFYVEYDNCPTNVLFLLRNHTKGKEERIFTFENDRQVWW